MIPRVLPTHQNRPCQEIEVSKVLLVSKSEHETKSGKGGREVTKRTVFLCSVHQLEGIPVSRKLKHGPAIASYPKPHASTKGSSSQPINGSHMGHWRLRRAHGICRGLKIVSRRVFRLGCFWCEIQLELEDIRDEWGFLYLCSVPPRYGGLVGWREKVDNIGRNLNFARLEQVRYVGIEFGERNVEVCC